MAAFIFESSTVGRGKVPFICHAHNAEQASKNARRLVSGDIELIAEVTDPALLRKLECEISTITGVGTMKYLQDYQEAAQSEAFRKYGAFFAFSSKQFHEQRKEGVKYTHLGLGLICPSDNAKTLTDALKSINEAAIKQDMVENGKKAIIWRELANHECQISGHPEACLEKLAGYPITKEEILKEWPAYYDHCVENNYF